MTRYTPLFAKPGTFVLQLDNLIETGLDGEYACEWSASTIYVFEYIDDAQLATLYATFYASSAKHPPGLHADVIIPISTLANDTGDVISVPPTFSVCTPLRCISAQRYIYVLRS